MNKTLSKYQDGKIHNCSFVGRTLRVTPTHHTPTRAHTSVCLPDHLALGWQTLFAKDFSGRKKECGFFLSQRRWEYKRGKIKVASQLCVIYTGWLNFIIKFYHCLLSFWSSDVIALRRHRSLPHKSWFCCIYMEDEAYFIVHAWISSSRVLITVLYVQNKICHHTLILSLHYLLKQIGLLL